MPYVEIQTSYLVLEPELWQKFEQAFDLRGGMLTAFVNQILEDYFRVNSEYYVECAKLDAKARGYKELRGAYYKDLVENDVKPWSGDLPPEFGLSPLSRIRGTSGARKNQHRIKQIKLSEYHVAMLRLSMEIDDLTLIQVTSKIVVWHLHQYWDATGGYQWQIAGSEQETLEPEI